MAKVRESAIIGGISGRTGNAVFVKGKYGTILRERPLPSDSKTPKQMESRNRMRIVGQAWRNMTLAHAAAWRAFAEAEAGYGSDQAVSAQLIFTRLGTKFLQANPGLPVPVVPPVGAFPGDSVRFSCVSVSGAVRVSGSVANAAGVVTEVLLQKLPSVHCRTYLQRYRTTAFHAFSAGESLDLPVSPGVYAVATRFVYAATGQATDLIETGVVAV
ncbi:MAG: hypothetical protein K8R88_01280 [Armatimonadetes bacterium]|nr:hypothetical protein [Armatimonadota bacterium]